ncbi:hypothetical protein DXG01_001473 [Tephrocybe rancida]|nr:hypothetical protein DXG01_001473 [Tephrocybe rancida]
MGCTASHNVMVSLRDAETLETYINVVSNSGAVTQIMTTIHRMPSSERANKDKSAYDKNSNNPFRNQTALPPNTRTNEPIKEDLAPIYRGTDVPSTGPSPTGETSVPSTQTPAISPEAPIASSQASVPEQTQEPTPRAPGIRTSVGSAIESASETVKPYLPGSVAAYLPASPIEKRSDFPSHEVPGGSGTGVGSLPGNFSEAGVAKLPEERSVEAHQQRASPASQDIPPRKVDPAAKLASNTSTSPTMLQSAKGYLPDSVAAYLPGGVPAGSPLPSKEKPGGSAGGVGSLPGNYSEVSVAKLPEERRLESLPSHEDAVPGKSGGVGPLPGPPYESRVALLPEERIHPQYDTGVAAVGGAEASAEAGGLGAMSGGTGSHMHQPEGDGQKFSPGGGDTNVPEHGPGTGAGPGIGAGVGAGVGAAGIAAAAHQHGSSDQSANAARGGGTQHLDIRNDPGYHPASLHPLDEKFKSTTPTANPSAQQHVAPQAAPTDAIDPKTADRHSTSGSDGRSSLSSGERHKVGFMDKVKGEAKVISGKLGHNEKKIEEGRQMMGK